MTLSYRRDTAEGGMEITISLTAEEVTAIGGDDVQLVDHLDTALYGLALLRTSRRVANDDLPLGPEDLYRVLNDVGVHLLPRLEGIRDAAIRAHKQAGGSHGDLAVALEIPRATAQSKRRALEDRPSSTYEQWATHEPHTAASHQTGSGNHWINRLKRWARPHHVQVDDNDHSPEATEYRAARAEFDADPVARGELRGVSVDSLAGQRNIAAQVRLGQAEDAIRRRREADAITADSPRDPEELRERMTKEDHSDDG